MTLELLILFGVIVFLMIIIEIDMVFHILGFGPPLLYLFLLFMLSGMLQMIDIGYRTIIEYIVILSILIFI